MDSWLTKKAPSAVLIDGERYELNTSFRNCLLAAYALEDDELTEWEKQEVLIENLYKEPHPAITQEAIDQVVKFLMCGDISQKQQQRKLCDLRKDGVLIYAAILNKGIDLDQTEDMHWWTFMSHFSEISESTFNRIVYLRQQQQSGKLTKEERKECDRIGWETIYMIDVEELD